MKHLREHLQAAKAEYESLKYPGDLAAETLGRPDGSRRWTLALGGLAGLAAAAAVALVLWGPSPNLTTEPEGAIAVVPSPPSTAPSTTDAQYSLSDIERPAWPSRPTMGSFPSLQAMQMPSAPRVPSWNAVMQEFSTSTTTTEESI